MTGPELFTVLAKELRLLDQEAASIEPTLQVAALDDPDLRRLQRFDYLRQHLQALRSVLERLGHAAPGGDTYDLAAAATDISLGEVRARLRREATEAAKSGELDLF